MNKYKLLQKAWTKPNNMRFAEIVSLAECMGFRLTRVSGSHHIFVHPSLPELLNLQNQRGKAKPYQVRQFLALVEEYNLDYGD